MSYIGFLGRDISINDNTSFISNWNFEKDKVSGIKYADFDGYYIDPMQNSSYDRVLYAVFTDDKVTLEGRGKASRSVISKHESAEETEIILENDKVRVATKTVTSGVFEYEDHNGIVARDNYIYVSTIPQLYYRYKHSSGSEVEYYNTQYILGKDLTIKETEHDIDVMGKLYGQRLIYMNGYNINVYDENHNLFDTTNVDKLHPVYNTNSLSFVGSNGSSIIYASLSDATEFINCESDDNSVEEVLISDVTIKGGRHISSLVKTNSKLHIRNATVSDLRYISGNMFDVKSGGKLQVEGLNITNNDLTANNIINIESGADFEVATDSKMSIDNNTIDANVMSINGNKDFGIYGDINIVNNTFTGTTRRKIANVTGRAVLALGNVELKVKIMCMIPTMN